MLQDVNGGSGYEGRFMRKITVDYHMHTTLSADGANTMQQMCERAIEIGLTEIALTDHFELDSSVEYETNRSQPQRFPHAMFSAYQEQLATCQVLFADRLEIKVGLELGQSHVNPQMVQQILAQMPFDYILGSLHKIDSVGFYWMDYTEMDLEELQQRNLTELYRMVDTGNFDCLGHIDLLRRYAARDGHDLTMLSDEPQTKRILTRLIEREKGLELNTSGLRQPLGEIIPNLDLLRLYRQLGGEIITFGSDAHHVDDLGEGLDEACLLAKQAGFTQGARYTKRKPIFYDLPA